MEKQSLSAWLRLTLEIVFYYITLFMWDKKKLPIPQLDKTTLVLSKKACDIVEEIKSNKLRASTVLAAVKERISKVNPIINAIIAERYSMAIKDAKSIDDILNANTSDATVNKPILGVPFTVQESIGVRDMPYTLGLVSRKHLRSPVDSTCIEILKDAGGILVGLTNVPEGDIWCETRNNVFGQTGNPHHVGRTVGGSGGGEAAIVTSICSSFGISRDFCGSSIMAASYCGVFCHVPTPGMVLSNGVGPNNNKTLNPAVVARNADDLTLVMTVLSQRNANSDVAKLDINDIKFYYVDLPISDRKTSRRQFEKFVSTIKKDLNKNVEVITIDKLHKLPWLRRCWDASQRDEHSHVLANRKGKVIGVIELIKKILGLSRHTLGAILSLINYPNLSENDVIAANNTLTNIKDELIDTLGSDGVLILQMGIDGAPYHYFPFAKQNENSYWSFGSLIQCPVTQVPLGVNDEGMPFGIQVVSAPYNDALCLRTAKYLEECFGGHVAPCDKE